MQSVLNKTISQLFFLSVTFFFIPALIMFSSFSASAFFSPRVNPHANCALPLYLAALQSSSREVPRKVQLQNRHREITGKLKGITTEINVLKRKIDEAIDNLAKSIGDYKDDTSGHVTGQIYEYMREGLDKKNAQSNHCGDDSASHYSNPEVDSYFASSFEAFRPPFSFAFLQVIAKESFSYLVPEAEAKATPVANEECKAAGIGNCEKKEKVCCKLAEDSFQCVKHCGGGSSPVTPIPPVDRKPTSGPCDDKTGLAKEGCLCKQITGNKWEDNKCYTPFQWNQKQQKERQRQEREAAAKAKAAAEAKRKRQGQVEKERFGREQKRLDNERQEREAAAKLERKRNKKPSGGDHSQENQRSRSPSGKNDIITCQAITHECCKPINYSTQACCGLLDGNLVSGKCEVGKRDEQSKQDNQAKESDEDECDHWKRWGNCTSKYEKGKVTEKLCTKPQSCTIDTGIRLNKKSKCTDALKELKKLIAVLKQYENAEKVLTEEQGGITNTLILGDASTKTSTEAKHCAICQRIKAIKEIVDPAPSGWEIFGDVAKTLGVAGLGLWGINEGNKLRDSQGLGAKPELALGLTFPFLMKGLHGAGPFGSSSSALACSPTMATANSSVFSNHFMMQRMRQERQMQQMQQMQLMRAYYASMPNMNMMNMGNIGFTPSGNVNMNISGMDNMSFMAGFMTSSSNIGFLQSGNGNGHMQCMAMMPGCMGIGNNNSMVGMRAFIQRQEAVLAYRKAQMNNYMQTEHARAGIKAEIARLQMQYINLLHGGGSTSFNSNITMGGGGNSRSNIDIGGGGNERDSERTMIRGL